MLRWYPFRESNTGYGTCYFCSDCKELWHSRHLFQISMEVRVEVKESLFFPSGWELENLVKYEVDDQNVLDS
jgi:hypothetical protein